MRIINLRTVLLLCLSGGLDKICFLVGCIKLFADRLITLLDRNTTMTNCLALSPQLSHVKWVCRDLKVIIALWFCWRTHEIKASFSPPVNYYRTQHFSMIPLPVDSVLVALTRELNTLILYIFVSIITDIVEDIMVEITEVCTGSMQNMMVNS